MSVPTASLPLLHSPADILRWALIALGVGSDPSSWATGVGGAWPIFNDGEPSNPDNCLTTYDTAWQDDGRAMVTGETFHHYGVQIRVRSTTSNIGYVKAESIHSVLDETLYNLNVVVGGTTYLVWCANKTGVVRLGKDAPNSKRSLHTVNCVAPIFRVA